MFLDRSLQLSILKELRSIYPDSGAVQRLQCFEDSRQFHGNLMYLHEHNLVGGEISHSAQPDKLRNFLRKAIITADGLDFLEDDGGLGAILGKVVVKFDDNDLGLLLKAIDTSDAPPDKKSAIKDTIKSLPAEGLKQIYTRLLNYGLDKTPDVLRLIQTAIDQN